MFKFDWLILDVLILEGVKLEGCFLSTLIILIFELPGDSDEF